VADVSVYSQSIQTFSFGGIVIHTGDVRPNADAAVTTNPQFWKPLSDGEFLGGNITVSIDNG
jgi:hypothetical protein